VCLCLVQGSSWVRARVRSAAGEFFFGILGILGGHFIDPQTSDYEPNLKPIMEINSGVHLLKS